MADRAAIGSAQARYSRVAIAFHWTIALLVIVNLVIGLFHDAVPLLRAAMKAHMAIGITVLVLTAGRIAWRLAHRAPPLPAAMPAWEKASAHLVHWGLYALLLVMPLTGWLMVSNPARPAPLSWFGLFPLPHLPATSGVAGAAHEGHELLGWLMAALVVLHIAAALRHHLILRDNVLARMLPGVRRSVA